MKIYVITSNNYTHVCPINIHFLNKYWENQDVTLLGYENVLNLKGLPDNVVVESLGKQSDFGKSWTDALIPYFAKVEDEYFVILVDDFILLNEVNPDKMGLIEEEFINNNVEKAVIGGGIAMSNTRYYTDDLLQFYQGIRHRSTLHPSVWKREYFLKYLKPNMSAWQFEVANDTEASRDGATIIADKYRYPEERHLFSALNLFNKGKLTIDSEGNVLDNQPSSRFWDKQDLIYIWEKLHAS